jgi:choline dehydrogenase-like flavoprotein
MGTDPAHSVLNRDLRVHTVDNLYVAGGSVFPTSGCANPTMTIVALSIRLAEHLRTTVAHEVTGRQIPVAVDASS